MSPGAVGMIRFVKMTVRNQSPGVVPVSQGAFSKGMRDCGFGDKAILEINQITGFFAWCNRTVDGLGVEMEAFWDDPEATNI